MGMWSESDSADTSSSSSSSESDTENDPIVSKLADVESKNEGDWLIDRQNLLRHVDMMLEHGDQLQVLAKKFQSHFGKDKMKKPSGTEGNLLEFFFPIGKNFENRKKCKISEKNDYKNDVCLC